MNKDIKYNGLTAVPSDYECSDGDLATVLNLVPEDGALKPVQPPMTILTLDKGVRVLFIHKTATFTHYIIYDERSSDDGSPASNGLYWIDNTLTTFTPSGTSSKNYLGKYASLYSVNAVGNTLLFLTADGIQYYLWKGDNNLYKYLGDHLPDLSISFGLQGHPSFYIADDEAYEKGDKKQLTFVYRFSNNSKHPLDYHGSELSDEDIEPFTNCVMGKLNKTIMEKATQKGRFALPFLVRYALRLYDGSLIHHSAPILMTPSSNANEFVMCDGVDGGTEGFLTMSIMIMACDIDYYVVRDNEGEYNNLDDWSDIVKSVDIFVSKPIYPYNQSGTINAPTVQNTKQLYEKKEGDGITLFHGRIVGTPVRTTKIVRDNSTEAFSSTNYYMPWEFSMIRTAFYNGLRIDTRHEGADGLVKTRYDQSESGLNYFLQLPKWENDDSEKNDLNMSIAKVANFYLLKKIELDDLKIASRTKIDIEEDYLAALTSRETMTDDYLSHERLVARRSHAYNSRINLANIDRKLFRGFSAESMRAYINAAVDTITNNWSYNASQSTLTIYLRTASETKPLNITCEVPIDGTTYYVTSTGVLSIFAGYAENSIMYSYPIMGATTLWEWNDIDTVRRKVELEKHDFLNLAFHLIPASKYLTWTSQDTTTKLPQKTSNDLPVVEAANKLYTSEVNNPFLFKAGGINSVGTGRIIGISSAVKALSQGQFGQFPLYCFTSDGIWAMEVSSTGTYNAKQPVTRDVCTDADSITQLDSSVLFATDRGLMLIEGAETTCLSDIINGLSTYSPGYLPKIADIVALSNFNVSDISLLPFTDFAAKCRMIYDYTHQRIIVYNPSYSYAYIYSLKSKQWGMMQSTIKSSVNSYPDALAMLSDGSFVNFSKEDKSANYKAIAITRPLKLDAPDIHKTVRSIIQRGYFRGGNVKSVLYASRDLFNWFIVWTSADHYLRGFSGTPYKYYRLALLCNLDDDENIAGFSVEYITRLTDKLR